MKALSIFLILSLFSGFLFSQTNDEQILDSLTNGKNLNEQFEIVSNEVNKYNSENLQKRLFYSRALLDIANQTSNVRLIGRAYYDLAYSYEIIGQYDLAIDACFEALKYLDKANDTLLIGMTYNEIGLIYSASNNTSELLKAIEYFNKFLKIQIERNDTAEIAGAYSNIGLIYIYMHNGDSAYYYSKKALGLREKIKQERTIPISLGNIGISLFYLGQKDSALYYYDKAIELYTKLNNLYGLNETYRNYITFYLDENEAEKAKYYIDRYDENSLKINSLRITQTSNFNKYQYYKAINNSDEALKYFELYKSISDTINDDKIKNRIANVEAVYRLDKREKEIALLQEKDKLRDEEEKNRKQRNTFIFILIALLVTILFIIAISTIRKSRHKRKLLELENQAFEKEKALAKSELEKSKLKEEELNTQLEYKSKQLTSHALNMMKKNQFLQELENDILHISKDSDDKVKNKLRNLKRSIARMNKSEKDWELFKNYFEEVNQGFYNRISDKHEGLSSNDNKLLALIKLNMNIKETASVLNISPDSVKTARYRLRKKIGLKQDEDLYEFVSKI
ncbi:MAG: tetratricopeptide repeat protein [Saprospiraceae bacterium]|nr:tetratricopeptide repeat protein [Saprospiraceae bacterium]